MLKNKMSRGKNKRKKCIQQKSNVKNNNSFSRETRRSSMRVNLSFTSDLSDSENHLLSNLSTKSNKGTLEKSLLQNDIIETIKQHKIKQQYINYGITCLSPTNFISTNNDSHCFIDNINESEKISNNSLMYIKEKEQQLNKSCMQLKDAIMNKTKALFDRKNELAIKTSEVLATSVSSANNKRSPSIRVNIGKNDQIIMSGDGRKQNPVQVNFMLNDNSLDNKCNISSKEIDKDCADYYQNIVSTPKKLRIDNYIKGRNNHDKISPTILRIPTIKLFNDDNDLNNSKSKIKSFHNVNNSQNIIVNTNEKSQNNLHEINSNQLNCMSPILSQGMRKTRLSHLSSKKKCIKNFTKISSRLSSSVTNEKFCNRKMFTCSSFIDQQDKTAIKNKMDNIYKFTCQNENKTVNNRNTISLINSTDSNKTINISNNTNQSSMELTAISSHVPIIRRSFQQIIHKSLILDHMINDYTKEIQTHSSLTQKQVLSNTITNLNNQDNNLKQVDQAQHNIVQGTNTSIEEIKLVDHITQKENKIPNNISERINTNDKSDLEEINTIIQRNANTLSSSIHVPTSLKNKKTLLIPNTIHEVLRKSDSINFLKANIKNNQKKQNNDTIASQQPSTIRSSMDVNTSLDSIKKSPITKTKLDFNQILSMVIETSSNENKNNGSKYIMKDQSSDSNSELENVSLIERIKNLPTLKRFDKEKLNKVRKSIEYEDTNSNNSNSIKQSVEKNETSCNFNNTSFIEGTPYPISRSALFKTIIKNNIAMNTLDPRKFIESLLNNEDSNNEFQTIISNRTPVLPYKEKNICMKKKVQSQDLSDIIFLNSCDESLNESKKRKKLVINESLNNSTISVKIKFDKRNENKKKNKKMIGKRKLYPLRENSQLISFTPTEAKEKLKEYSQDAEKRNKKIRGKKKQNKLIEKRQESINESDLLENPRKVEKVKKKSRKIISKKIIVKKATNMTILENMLKEKEKLSQRLSARNSLNEFDIKSINQQKTIHKNHKIIIVVTGLTKKEKDLVKSIIKGLGSASLELNVTFRTTHVISSGIRTINLLKGILRGCWLLSLEWVLKSLENQKWLDPTPYEMSHFSKAVQENRRDRQLFGKAYVSELFVTCGIIYIEKGTSPPASTLKELVKIAGGRITEDETKAEIIIGSQGLREIWILDSITTGEIQSIVQYKRN